MNSLEKACQCLSQSYNCYKEWGAVAKMEHLIENHLLLKNVRDEPVSDVTAIMENVNLELIRDRSACSTSLIIQGKKKLKRFLDN